MTFDVYISESTEYCQPGEFSATCGPQDVLLVTSALYGRMRLGKCVKIDYGSIGCAADVLSEMDRKCSGRHECTFDVDSLHGKQPCPGDLTPYLEATYECISGKCRKQLSPIYFKLVCPFPFNTGYFRSPTRSEYFSDGSQGASTTSTFLMQWITYGRSHFVTLHRSRTHSVATTLPEKVNALGEYVFTRFCLIFFKSNQFKRKIRLVFSIIV